MSKLLESNAMIVQLAVNNWTATKHDPTISEDLTQLYNAENNSARVNKKLINKDSLKAIRDAIAAARRWHNSLTLPWGDHGDRLLPVDLHELYVEKIDHWIIELEKARYQFLNEYEDLIEEAKLMLGKMFNRQDYPSRSEVAQKFGIAYEINPVPSAKHFIVNLTEKEAEKIKADLEKRMTVKLDNAIVQLYERLETALRRLIMRLGTDKFGKPKRIHSTALETMRELADAIPSMNIVSDSRLNEISERIKEVLENVAISDLRNVSKVHWRIEETNRTRAKLSKELGSIAAAYFGTDPGAEIATPELDPDTV